LQDAFVSLGVKNTPVVPISPGQCITLTPPPDATPTIKPYLQTLDQSNVSWRVGSTYKLEQETLFYGTISQGYKAGIFSPIGATITTQLAPARQEGLLAYEAGLKAPLLEKTLQFNASVFHYDYSDKQVRARILDPVFGLLEKLINIPKSEVTGVEGELVAQPIRGLNLSLSGTFLNSKVNGDTSGFYNQEGYTGNFKGSRLPYTPEVNLVADGQYQWDVRNGVDAFVGTSVVYHGDDNATFATSILLANDFKLPSYATVDLRAGLKAEDGSWQVSLFSRNIFNQYYITSVFNSSDTIYRYAGQPMTYGISIHIRTQ
jgi:iron complex outermembrane receptor protein